MQDTTESPPEASATSRPKRLLHTMLRVRDLDRSLHFYTTLLGMKQLRRQDFEAGRFTLAFVGYGSESRDAVLELTHNWGERDYELGTAFGHVGLAVDDVYAATAALAAQGVKVVRAPGPLAGDPTELIAFVLDPDGYRVELIESRHN
jgi:lactoylglutathione lyase